jgi:hypothetical protein
MIRRRIFAATSALAVLALAPQPLAAQDDAKGFDDAMAALGGMLEAEPLTAEQQARLPAAEAVIAKAMPAGTMGEVIDKMMGGSFGQMMAMAPGGATPVLARGLGIDPVALDLSPDQADALASLFDPAWKERQKREIAMLPDMMREMVALMEPGIRKAMAELYAIRFSARELGEIDAFLATPTGQRYARESFLMSSDPRMMASSLGAMPAVMGLISDMERRSVEKMADLPKVRSFAELSAAEKAKVAEATGYTVEDIEAGLEAGEDAIAAAEAAADAAVAQAANE